jgi:hypothetical protein
MKYVILTVAAAAFWSAAISSRASDKIPASTLSDMGLSGMTVMSDREASNVRGMFAFAGGISWAVLEDADDGSAGSINPYVAIGRYHAEGASGSVATRTRVRSRLVVNDDGDVSLEVRTRATIVGAAGFSRASSF